jgi:diacylglycerol kinase (ATP)
VVTPPTLAAGGGHNRGVPPKGGTPRIALLANPRSGGGDAPDAAAALRRLGAEVEAFEIKRHREAARAGIERIVVAGGDGSIGCAAQAAARAGVPLAVIPVGTANDFARFLELPDDPERACRLALEGEETRRLDLARIGDLPFVNVASAGLAPVAAREASGLKSAIGPLAYAAGALRAALSASPVRCRVTCDGDEVFAGKAWQVTVANTGAFGAGATLDSDPEDGKLDAVAIEATSRIALVRRGYGLRAGRVESQSGVASARGSDVQVEIGEGTEFNVDGEVIEAGPRAFAVEARAFEVVTG